MQQTQTTITINKQTFYVQHTITNTYNKYVLSNLTNSTCIVVFNNKITRCTISNKRNKQALLNYVNANLITA